MLSSSSSSSTTASPSSSILSYTSSKSPLSSISLPISCTTTSSSSPSSPTDVCCYDIHFFLVLTSPFDCSNFRLAMCMSSTATFRFLIFVPCIWLRNLRNLQSVSASLLGRFARFLLSALRANKICNLRSFRRMDFFFGKITYPNHMSRELSGRICCV